MSTVEPASELLAPLRTSRVALLTTFRRDGRGVATPVGIRVEERTAYFTTRARTWKVRRIANDPRVTAAPCDKRGKVRGRPDEVTVACTARRIPNPERPTLEWRFWAWIYRVFYRDVPVTYELVPVERHETE